MDKLVTRTKCCMRNLAEISWTCTKDKNVRTVTPIDKGLLLIKGIKSIHGTLLCGRCRRNIRGKAFEKLTIVKEIDNNDVNDDVNDYGDDNYVVKKVKIEYLNSALPFIDMVPISAKKCCSSNSYKAKKCDEVVNRIRNDIFNLDKENPIDEDKVKAGYFDEMMGQLKDAFAKTEKRDEKLRLLTVLPQSWTVEKIKNEFSTTQYMAKQSKENFNNNGILETLAKSKRSGIDPASVNAAVSYCESDNTGSPMPGKRDCTTMDSDGNKVTKQKRLLSSSIAELYSVYKLQNPTAKIGISTFSKLRPANCVFAGARNSHVVCVCKTHENMKLLFQGINLATLTNGGMTDHKDCLKKLVCNTEDPTCHFRTCISCPKTKKRELNILTVHFFYVVSIHILLFSFRPEQK